MLQSQVNMVSALVPRTCCSPQSYGSSWTCGDTCGRLWPPTHVGQGNVGPGWGRPAPDSRTATALLQAAEPSPPGNSAQTTRRKRLFKAAVYNFHPTGTAWNIWYIPIVTLHLFVSKSIQICTSHNLTVCKYTALQDKVWTSTYLARVFEGALNG